MHYTRMPIEIEAPEQLGYSKIACNLTESSTTDLTFKDLGLELNDLVLAYMDHVGHPGLRSLLSKDTQNQIGDSQILLTAGAAQALFIVSTSLLGAGDELLVVRPNYGTNLETPRALGARVKTLDLSFDRSWRTDPEEIARALTPHTRLVSITTPHNPTGAQMTWEEIQAVARICEDHGARLLVDETYREMSFVGVTPYAATLGPHVISVASLSKTYGLPGIRLGWLMCSDPKLFETFLAAKEQIQICGSALDEEVAFQFYQKRHQFLPGILESIRRRHGIVQTWIQNHPHLEWVAPQGGCVGFVRFRSKRPELTSSQIQQFYQTLQDHYKTHVGPGHWFEQPRTYFRLGYGWPDDQQLKQGLQHIDQTLAQVMR